MPTNTVKTISTEQECPICHKGDLLDMTPFTYFCPSCYSYFLRDGFIFSHYDYENYLPEDFKPAYPYQVAKRVELFIQVADEKLGNAITTIAAHKQQNILYDEIDYIKNSDEFMPINDRMIQSINEFLVAYESPNYDVVRRSLIKGLTYDDQPSDEDLDV